MDSSGEEEEEPGYPVGDEEEEPQQKYENNNLYDSVDSDHEHDEGADAFGGGSAYRPTVDYDSDDDKELSTGRDAREIANERMEAKIYAKADAEAEERAELEAMDPEGLGDDFEATQWLPPSIKEAYRFRAHNMFKGGEGSMLQTDVCSDSALSATACLYFLFVKECARVMFYMSILSVPLLAMAFFGERTSELDRDPMGLYLLTLGNVGYDRNAVDFATKSACKTVTPSSVNGTCIHLNSFEIAATDAANVLTAFEFLQGVVFLYFIHRIRKLAKKLMDDHEVGEVTIRDYSVMVRDVPKDVTPTDLLIHFNNLYPLDQEDWYKRPRVQHAHKVKHIENSQQSLYMNSWVADITLHKKIGRYINAFAEQELLMKKIQLQRAKMKMYSEGTPHARGPNPGKYYKAEKEMLALGGQLDEMADHVFHKNFHLDPEAEPDDLEQGEVHEAKIVERIRADVCCAFVTFQYSESMARCIEDYSFWNMFPLRYIYCPSALKLHGKHQLRVEHAPEPDELIWENIEVTELTHELRKAITIFVAFAAIIISFAIIVQAAIYKTKFAENVPRLTSCTTDIPNLYMQNNTFSSDHHPWAISTPDDISIVKLTRPPEGAGPGERVVLDNDCVAATGSSKYFYAVYTENGDWDVPVGRYDTSACNVLDTGTGLKSLNICPNIPALNRQDWKDEDWEGKFCPCFDMESTERCYSVECAASDIAGTTTNNKCIEFTSNTMGSCYCFDFLLNLVSETPASELLGAIKSLENHVCADFLVAYSASSGLTYGTSLLVVVVNSLILMILKKLTKWEKHKDYSEEQASYLGKVSTALYFSICIVVLIAYGNIEEMPEVLKSFSFFQGPYADFTAAWYSDVGMFLVTTLVIQAMTPLVIGYLQYYIVFPFRRFMYFGALETQSSDRFACQAQVNEMVCGPVFDATEGQAMLLALFFCSMTFATGIPVLLVLTFFFFVLTFRANKILLMRFFQKPPHGGDHVMRVCVKLLPVAGFLRLGFSIWMLGNPDVLEAAGLSASSLGSVSAGGITVDASSGGSTDLAGAAAADLVGKQSGIIGTLIARSVRPNCVPLLVLFVMMSLFFFVEFFWQYLPMHFVIKVVKCVLSIFRRKKKASVHTEITSMKIRRTNEETGEEEEEIVTDSSKFISPFEIHMLGHPLRQEQAPFTDDYISYCWDLVEEEKRMDTCFLCRRRALEDGDFLNDDDRVQNWHLVQEGQYMIKVKLWNRTTTHNGAIRRKGDKKRTFEIMDETGASSYELDRVERYKYTMKALEEAVILHEQLAENPDPEHVIHDEHTDKHGNVHHVPQLKKKPSIVGAYNHHSARLKMEKMSREDWEMDGSNFDDEYRRVAAKKAKKTSFELNNTASENYHSHEVEEEWSEGEEEEDEEGGEEEGEEEGEEGEDEAEGEDEEEEEEEY